ncbi:2536_t:CDS:2, partial [Scutellospora calospora]
MSEFPCEWPYTIIKGCDGESTFRNLLLAGTGLYAILAINDLLLIFIRTKIRYSKKTPLTTLDYFLFWVRSLDCLITALNIVKTHVILREILASISWALGPIGLYVYLSGIFLSIPRLSFDRFTSIEDKCKHSIWIPNPQKVKPILWSISIITIICILASSIIAGHYYRINNQNNRYVALSVQMSFCWLISVTIFASVAYYGSVLISLAQESMKLAGIDDKSFKFRIYKHYDSPAVQAGYHEELIN